MVRIRFAVAVVALAVLGLFAVAPGPLSADTKQTIRLVERATTDATTDTGEKGDTVGDLLTFANQVFDEKNATQVGTDQGFCVRVAKGVSWECFWTLTLADGQLTVEGPFLDAGDSVLAVTGGTGAYSAAEGQMKLHARNAAGSEYDFLYEIEK